MAKTMKRNAKTTTTANRNTKIVPNGIYAVMAPGVPNTLLLRGEQYAAWQGVFVKGGATGGLINAESLEPIVTTLPAAQAKAVREVFGASTVGATATA